MTYFWIGLVVFIALSPLISIMPTRRQRRIADLRQAAAMAGLFVKLREPPRPAPDSPSQVAFYGRQRPRGRRAVTAEARYLLTADRGWVCDSGQADPGVLEILPDIPAGVDAMVADGHSIGVFWDESGSPDDVRKIDAVLRQMLDRA